MQETEQEKTWGGIIVSQNLNKVKVGQAEQVFIYMVHDVYDMPVFKYELIYSF